MLFLSRHKQSSTIMAQAAHALLSRPYPQDRRRPRQIHDLTGANYVAMDHEGTEGGILTSSSSISFCVINWSHLTGSQKK